MADQFEQVFRVSDGEAVEGMSDHYIGNIPLTSPLPSKQILQRCSISGEMLCRGP